MHFHVSRWEGEPTRETGTTDAVDTSQPQENKERREAIQRESKHKKTNQREDLHTHTHKKPTNTRNGHKRPTKLTRCEAEEVDRVPCLNLFPQIAESHINSSFY